MAPGTPALKTTVTFDDLSVFALGEAVRFYHFMGKKNDPS
jgi:hypothetical protein